MEFNQERVIIDVETVENVEAGSFTNTTPSRKRLRQEYIQILQFENEEDFKTWLNQEGTWTRYFNHYFLLYYYHNRISFF
jgi:hypothetical protein